MKNRTQVFLFAFLALVAFSVNTAAQQTNYYDPQTFLLGYFNPDSFLEEPYAEWYNKEFDGYELNTEPFIQLTMLPVDKLSMKVVMGTWCPDSRRNVPRFMKIIESWGFPTDKIVFIGVDSYKVAPVDEYDGLDIERVPTFIIYYDNVEAGRIIENPSTSLEKDMLDIINKALKNEKGKK